VSDDAEERVREFLRQWKMFRDKADIIYGMLADPEQDETVDLTVSDLTALLDEPAHVPIAGEPVSKPKAEGLGELHARSLRTKHLERAHQNISKITSYIADENLYTYALLAAADAYMAGYYAAEREVTNPFIDLEAP